MKPRMPVALSGYGFPEWCPGYGPAPEPKAKPIKLDPRFLRPDRFVQMATQNWEMH